MGWKLCSAQPNGTPRTNRAICRFGDLARISQVKEELVRNLRLLVAEERRQLEADLARKLEELDEMKRREAPSAWTSRHFW